MYRYFCILIISLLVLATGCRTSYEKRIKKDLAGIDEQLYELEKGQLKAQQQVKQINRDVALLKDAEAQKVEKEDKNKDNRIYQEGYKQYLEQNYSQSIELLAQLTGKFADNALTDDALYWQAEAYFKLNQVDKALNYYQLIYRYFPFSNKADYSLYKIGMIYYNKKDYSRARLAFNRLVNEYKSSDLYKASSIKLTQLKKRRKR